MAELVVKKWQLGRVFTAKKHGKAAFYVSKPTFHVPKPTFYVSKATSKRITAHR